MSGYRTCHGRGGVGGSQEGQLLGVGFLDLPLISLARHGTFLRLRKAMQIQYHAHKTPETAPGASLRNMRQLSWP